MNSSLQGPTMNVLLSVLVCGCTMMKPYRYNVYWRNASAQQLTDVRVSYGRFATTAGGYLWATEPLPGTAKVEFRTPDGTLHTKAVHISEDIRRNVKTSDLFFEIGRDLEVTVRLRTLEQRNAQSEASGP